VITLTPLGGRQACEGDDGEHGTTPSLRELHGTFEGRHGSCWIRRQQGPGLAEAKPCDRRRRAGAPRRLSGRSCVANLRGQSSHPDEVSGFGVGQGELARQLEQEQRREVVASGGAPADLQHADCLLGLPRSHQRSGERLAGDDPAVAGGLVFELHGATGMQQR
jgi:hypothetical protein